MAFLLHTLRDLTRLYASFSVNFRTSFGTISASVWKCLESQAATSITLLSLTVIIINVLELHNDLISLRW